MNQVPRSYALELAKERLRMGQALSPGQAKLVLEALEPAQALVTPPPSRPGPDQTL